MKKEYTPRARRVVRSENIDQTKPAAKIVDKFGGLAEFCRKVGLKRSTVWAWMERGFIPLAHHAVILKAAKKHTIALEMAEFGNLTCPTCRQPIRRPIAAAA